MRRGPSATVFRVVVVGIPLDRSPTSNNNIFPMKERNELERGKIKTDLVLKLKSLLSPNVQILVPVWIKIQ